MNQPKWKYAVLLGVALTWSFSVACGDDDKNGNSGENAANKCEFVVEDGVRTAVNPLADCDGDGMSNGFELLHGFDPEDPDEDGNGQLDGWDDTDNDGLPNWAEEAVGLDPRNPTTPVPGDEAQSALEDGLKDSDGDGAVNMAEAWMGKPNVHADPDKVEPFVGSVWDPAVANDDVFKCDPHAEGDTIFEELAFRFTELKITTPQALGSLLADMMEPDIEAFNINIMAPVTNFDRTHCVSYFELYAASGVWEEVDGAKSYKLEDLDAIEDVGPIMPTKPVRAVVVQTSATTAFFRTTVPLDMVFPGMMPVPEGVDPEDVAPEDRNRFLLDLAYITAAGILTLEDDGQVSLSAALDGSIPYESAKNTQIVMPSGDKITIGNLLVGNHIEQYAIPDKDSKNLRKDVGTNIRATFEAGTVPFEHE